MLPRIWRALRGAVGLVKPNGWTVLGLGLLAALGAWATHWPELGVIAAACLLLLALALPFLLGRTRVAVDLTVEAFTYKVTAG